MQTFEIDVSGEDVFDKDYTICIANKDGIIKGFKFDRKTTSDLLSKYDQEAYRYKKSKKNKSTLKIRLYSIIIYYLFKSLKMKEEIVLNICRDFYGRESDIKHNLKFFLEEKLNLKINHINFEKLDKNSNADRYAYLMRKDKKNKMKTYVNIKLKDIERWLIK